MCLMKGQSMGVTEVVLDKKIMKIIEEDLILDGPTFIFSNDLIRNLLN